MSERRATLNKSAIEDFLKSPEVQAELERRADGMAMAAGEGFEAFGFVGHDRAHSGVHAATWLGFRREREERALTRAIDAAR